MNNKNDILNIFNHRKTLVKTIKAIKNKKLTIGFIGGSITDSRNRNRWPESVIAWFTDTFPDVKVIVENAAIGATGSDLAVFRVERDIIERKCDLVFIEFAVNDNEQPTEKRMRTREGLLRKLLILGESDLVLTYTFMMDMYEDMINNRVPPSIKEFEILAEHYNISSVWMGLYALNEVIKGLIRWEEWLPDGLHPESRGSYVYGQSVIRFLEKELLNKNLEYINEINYKIPKPYNINNWEKSYILPLYKVNLKGPWTLRRCTTFQWIDQVLDTSAIGAGLSFSFIGRALVLGFDFGKTSAEFMYKLDDGEWIEVERDRPDWCGDEGWYRITYIGDDFDYKEHKFKLKVIHGNRPECKGTNLRLAMIGVVR
jgi:lysophospholipase L1-like esterase